MSDEQTQIQIKPRQVDYLRKMAETYGLADADKAARCLVDYAIEKKDQEEAIFSLVRCRDC